jgi:hypothetical protein
LNTVADFNKEAAASEAVTLLLPAVRAGTRMRTGLLASGWGVEQGAFVNEVPYSVPQEFGTEFIEGSYATIRAWESGEADVLKAYEKEIDSAARKAGFDPK